MPKIRSSAAHPTAKLTVAQILQQSRNASANPAAASPAIPGVSPPGPRTRGTILSRKLARRASRLQTAGQMDADPAALAAELGTAVPIGKAVVEVLALAYTANVPVILIGPHGIGKSEIAEAAAAEMKIGFISRDLSLMEPPDLVGLPQIKDGATSFLPPEFLPRDADAKGLLLIEEINRAPRYMQASCLELLTSRRLNSYALPAGVLPIACINPQTDGYVVELLDRALMSRFMKIEVMAATKPWTEWARRHGIHPKVIEYVESVPHALDESKGGSNPRSWSYTSKTLLAAGAEMLERSPDTIVAA
ncbi:MAG: AAA family ATPase, partial [Planctomycetia bacterium]